MAVKAPCVSSSSSLNPDAPHFVPSFFDTVDDFSSEWWTLVKNTPAFRDYWIREKWESVSLMLEDCLDQDMSAFDGVDLDEAEDTLKEQDVNLCTARRPVKVADFLLRPPAVAATKNLSSRQPRHKIVKVPPKLADAKMRKGLVATRIQQPR